MQSLKFMLKSIWISFQTEKLLQLLILLGMIISNVLFLLFGDFYFRDTQTLEEKEKQMNRVSFAFMANDNLKAVFDDLRSEQAVSQVILQCTKQSDLGITNIYASEPPLSLRPEQVKFGGMKTNRDSGWFSGSENFNVNLRSQNIAELQINTPLQIENKELICSGVIMTNDFDVLISTQDFLDIENALSFDITYVFDGDAGTGEIERINEYIVNKYDPLLTSRPRESFRFSLLGLLQMLGVNVLLVFLTIINYFFLYVFSMKKRFYLYSIMKLCGMKKSKLLFYLFSEMCIWFFISYLLTIPIYMLLSPIIIGTPIIIGSFVTQLLYSFMILFCMNFVIFLCVSLPTIRKNAMTLYYESVVES